MAKKSTGTTSRNDLEAAIKATWKTRKKEDKGSISDADLNAFIKLVFDQGQKPDTTEFEEALQKLLGVD
ncbi:MAG: hypothetical protein HOE69_03060 [Euryarchaeota archaeon]|jgi:hypothetical protein|nr:hypothetical protein [Euryarchaeota archaeon]